jgi:hypothetical protein
VLLLGLEDGIILRAVELRSCLIYIQLDLAETYGYYYDDAR